MSGINFEGVGVDEVFDSEIEISSLHALWRAVILQALLDAKSENKKSEYKKYKKEALKWLFDNEVDFNEICMMAGFEPEYIRKRVKIASNNNFAWRDDQLTNLPLIRERKRMIIKAIRNNGPMTVGELADYLKIKDTHLIRVLGLLKKKRIICRNNIKKAGRAFNYSLNQKIVR